MMPAEGTCHGVKMPRPCRTSYALESLNPSPSSRIDFDPVNEEAGDGLAAAGVSYG